MPELGLVSNDEMVLAFLRAEIDSSVWGRFYTAALDGLRFERLTLIDNADLNDRYANCVRGLILGAVRGYGRNDFLFQGFPTDTTWRRVLLNPSELRRLTYINSPPFSQLADTRAVEVGARNYRRDDGLAARVDNLVSAIKQGVSLRELILAEDGDGLVILDGNTRATAYVNAPINVPFLALIGSSPTMHQWNWR